MIYIIIYLFVLGFECTKRLRKIEANICAQEMAGGSVRDNHQLVIVCSANADEETRELAYDAGVDGFLEKPLQLDLFLNVLKRLKNNVNDDYISDIGV